MKKIIILLLLSCSLLGYSQETKPEDINIIEINEDSKEVPFAVIENVPVYRGCDESLGNASLKKCMSEKISKFVATNFNTSISKRLDLPNGKIRISVIFKIDTIGSIIDVRARAPRIELEQEAIRVIKRLPKMDKPGYLKGEAVTVSYSLPIVFQVDNPVKVLKTFPVYRGCSENLDYENQKKCTTKKVIDFVKVSFDIELADKLFPQEQSTQFKIEFVINKKGKAEHITAKAHKREIAAEAIKVLKRLPKFKAPGSIDGISIDTPFSILMTLYFD